MTYEKDKIIHLKSFNGDIKYCNLLEKLATYLFVSASHDTLTGNWCLEFAEIEEDLGIEKGFITNEIAQDIKDTLFKIYDKQVAECSIELEEKQEESYFDITLYSNYVLEFLEDDASFE